MLWHRGFSDGEKDVEINMAVCGVIKVYSFGYAFLQQICKIGEQEFSPTKGSRNKK